MGKLGSLKHVSYTALFHYYFQAFDILLWHSVLETFAFTYLATSITHFSTFFVGVVGV